MFEIRLSTNLGSALRELVFVYRVSYKKIVIDRRRAGIIVQAMHSTRYTRM